MKIQARRLLVRVRLGRNISVFENALIDTGAAFTVIPPEIADLLELELNRDSKSDIPSEPTDATRFFLTFIRHKLRERIP